MRSALEWLDADLEGDAAPCDEARSFTRCREPRGAPLTTCSTPCSTPVTAPTVVYILLTAPAPAVRNFPPGLPSLIFCRESLCSLALDESRDDLDMSKRTPSITSRQAELVQKQRRGWQPYKTFLPSSSNSAFNCSLHLFQAHKLFGLGCKNLMQVCGRMREVGNKRHTRGKAHEQLTSETRQVTLRQTWGAGAPRYWARQEVVQPNLLQMLCVVSGITRRYSLPPAKWPCTCLTTNLSALNYIGLGYSYSCPL